MSHRTFNKTLDIPDYKQFDPRWASEQTSTGATMKAVGCAITSAAMVLGDDPLTHLNKMKPHDNPYDWTYAAKLYNKTYEAFYGDFDDLKAEIFDYIYNKEMPVITRVTGSSTHFLVIKGIIGTLPVDPDGLVMTNFITPSMFKVNDPGSSYRDDLQDVFDKYYNGLTRIAVFK